MKYKLIIAMLVVLSVAAIGFSKPERITNKEAIEKKEAISSTLGDTNALVQAIMSATKVDDLKPILLKLLDATMIESGKKKPKED